MNEEIPETLKVPLTSKVDFGCVELIPIRPALISKNATVDPVPIFTSSWNVETPDTFRVQLTSSFADGFVTPTPTNSVAPNGAN